MRKGHDFPGWFFGRYEQFQVIIQDEHLEDGFYACRACGARCDSRRKRYCTKACRMFYWERVVNPLVWQHAKRAALKRDKFTCTLCGFQPEHVHEDALGDYAFGMEVDHVRPVALYPWEEFELENQRTLCPECHVAHGARPRPGSSGGRPEASLVDFEEAMTGGAV